MNYTFNQYINDRERVTELLNQRALDREEREELSALQQMLSSRPPSVKITNIEQSILPKVNKIRSMGGRRSIKKLKSKKKLSKKSKKRIVTHRIRRYIK